MWLWPARPNRGERLRLPGALEKSKSGQMSRNEALEKLRQPLYSSTDLLEQDKKCLADFMGISVATLERWVAKPPEKQSHYPHSRLNELAPLARKFRKFIE